MLRNSGKKRRRPYRMHAGHCLFCQPSPKHPQTVPNTPQQPQTTPNNPQTTKKNSQKGPKMSPVACGGDRVEEAAVVITPGAMSDPLTDVGTCAAARICYLDLVLSGTFGTPLAPLERHWHLGGGGPPKQPPTTPKQPPSNPQRTPKAFQKQFPTALLKSIKNQ